MSYTLEIWVMDGAGEQDPDYSYRYNTKDDLIAMLHQLVLEGGHGGSVVEHMNIINDRSNNHMV